MGDKVKMSIASLVTLLAALGAFSFKVEYEKSATQEKMGKLIVSLSKGCE